MLVKTVLQLVEYHHILLVRLSQSPLLLISGSGSRPQREGRVELPLSRSLLPQKT